MEQQYFVNVLQILDVATERGAWKGAEIEAIALVRKFYTMLQWVQKRSRWTRRYRGFAHLPHMDMATA